MRNEPNKLVPAAGTAPPSRRSSRLPSSLIARVRAALRSRVPVGYEDESGFHVEAGAGREKSSRTVDRS